MYLNDGTCVKEVDHCLTQNYYTGECEHCYNGYYLNNELQCIKCDDHCNDCDFENDGKCKSSSDCDDGYSLNESNECVKCNDDNCKKCDLYGGDNVCIDCMSGYTLLDDYESQTCVKCNIEHAKGCYYGYDPETGDIVQILNECEEGWIYSFSNSFIGECIKCGNHCTVCSPDNVNECYSCEEGYTSESNCVECSYGYAFDGSECVPDYVENCYPNEINNLQCDECYPTYAVDENGKCSSCNDENCLHCDHTTEKCYDCKNNADGLAYCNYNIFVNVLSWKARGEKVYYTDNGECKEYFSFSRSST